MRLTKDIIENSTRNCGHRGTDSTVYAGLRRAVCKECGYVTVERKAESKPGVLFQKPRATNT